MSAPVGCMFSSYTTKIPNIIHKFNQGALYSLAGQGSIFSRLLTSNIFLDFASMPWSVFLEITETDPGIRNERLYAPVSSGFFLILAWVLILNVSLSAEIRLYVFWPLRQVCARKFHRVMLQIAVSTFGTRLCRCSCLCFSIFCYNVYSACKNDKDVGTVHA